MTESIRHIWAITKRELRSYFASPVAYVFLVVFLIMAGFLTFSVGNYYENRQADLRQFFFWHPWIYLLLAPAAAMRLWSEEARSGTLELLFTLPVSIPQAIIGKFLAAWCFLTIALMLTAPVVFTTYYLGDPDPGVIIGGYLGSFLLAGIYLSVGMLTSAMTRNQVISFVVAIVLLLFLLLAGWPPVTGYLVRWAPLWLVNGVAATSFMPHFEALQRGVIDIRNIVYAVSVMGFMLFANRIVLEWRKSS